MRLRPCALPFVTSNCTYFSTPYPPHGLFLSPSLQERWNVFVNLTDPGFVPGNKTFDRVKYCLTGRLGLEFKFVMTWQPLTQADAVLADQVLSKLPGSRAVPAVELQHEFPEGFQVPVLSDLQSLPTDCEFYEWIGSTACRIDATSAGPLSYTSSMVCPEPAAALAEGGKSIKWTGLIAPARILLLLEAARVAVSNPEAGLPFVTVTVWGFADAPVSWNTQEHGFFNSGDNSYTYVLFPDDGRYWLFAAVGPHDTFSL